MKLLKITVIALIALTAVATIMVKINSRKRQIPMAYQPFKVFAMATPDSADYVEWKEEVDTVYTDDYNLTHVKFKQLNNL